MTFTTQILRPGVLNGVFRAGVLYMSELAQAVASLFYNNEQGLWYDPSDFSTMFQDSAGTTPVTAVGQPVGRILDKSGRGNHASQATAASRPVLQQLAGGQYYLLFDGVDDWLQTAAIDFTGTDKVNVFAGVRKLSDAVQGTVCELTSVSTNPGAFGMSWPSGAVSQPNPSFRSESAISVEAGSPAAPVTAVLTGIGNRSAPSVILRRNGVQVASSVSAHGAGTYANGVVFIGRRNGSSTPLNGHLYGLVIRGALSTDQQIIDVERALGAKTGVSIPV